MKHPWEPIIIAFAADTSVAIEGRGTYWSKWEIVNISDVMSWPEPMRVAPDYEQFFIAGYERVVESNWNGSAWQQQVLKAGFCHLSEEAAQQHRRAFVLANGGEL